MLGWKSGGLHDGITPLYDADGNPLPPPAAGTARHLLLTRTGFRIKYLRAIGRVRNLAVALEKVRAYGELASTLGRLLVPAALAERINFPLNPGDEMVVIAGVAS